MTGKIPFVLASLVLASLLRGHAEESLAIGGVAPADVLMRLGAKLEHGLTPELSTLYGRQFAIADLDHDARHSQAEYIDGGTYRTPEARRGIFMAADADNDGFVTAAEYTLNRVITEEASGILQAMDDDEDGMVQREEFIAHAESTLGGGELAGHVFDALDADQNEALRVSEGLRVWGQWARAERKSPEERLADLRLAELDAFWAEVSRSVREGDFAGYSATCHDKGVLVSGSSSSSYPLSKALARWKQGFLDTRAGNLKANVDFRFSQRLGDTTTAHETGIFLYTTETEAGGPTSAYVHFEALLVNEGRWRVMMEYQKTPATADEWAALGN